MIIVLSLTKNASLWNDAFAYHLTMTGGVGGAVNFGVGVNVGVGIVVVVG